MAVPARVSEPPTLVGVPVFAPLPDSDRFQYAIRLSADVQHFTPFGAIYRVPGATKPPAAAGGFASAPIFGSSGLSLAVFRGGTIAQLEAAATAVAATGVWVQDAAGRYRLLVINGPAFLRDEFAVNFPLGFPSVTPVTLTR